MIEIIDQKLRDLIHSDKRFVGFANKEPGGNASLLFQISDSQIGEIVRALDARDGAPFPERIIWILGADGKRAKQVHHYAIDRPVGVFV